MTIVDRRVEGCGVVSNYGNVANWKREWPLLVDFLDLFILYFWAHTPNTEHNLTIREPTQERFYNRCTPTSIFEVSWLGYVIMYCARSPLFVADFVP